MSYIKTNWQNSPSTNTPINAANLNHMEQGIYDATNTADSAAAGVAALQGLNYAPIPVTLAADMTDQNKIYVYLGSEAGYQANHWYYWSGSAWTEGGVYNSQALATDTTLTQAGQAADAKATGDRAGVIVSLGTGVDLNTLTTRGYYRLSYGGTYTNSPIVNDANMFKYVEVFVESTGAVNTVQRYTCYKQTSPTDVSEYIRINDGSSWKAWIKVASSRDLTTLNDSLIIHSDYVGGTDLNTVTTRGFFRLAYGGAMVHAPIVDDSNMFKFLEVFVDGTQIWQRYVGYKQTSPTDAFEYIRIYDGSAWKSWFKCFSMKDFRDLYDYAHQENTVVVSFTAGSIASQGNNVGDKLRVLSYNVANYNNDTATYVSDTKICNLRKVLNKANADIACIQEDREYIDSGNTKPSSNYLYYPKYPYTSGTGGVTIKTRFGGTHSYILKLSGNRVIRTYLLTYGDKKVLVISAHPIANYNNTGYASAESIAMRKSEYEEIFKWCNGLITLPSWESGVAVSVPTHTHTIIGMDGNSITDDDKTNLAALANTYNYVMGNGGYIGWFNTEFRTGYAIDNIIVSNNVIIENIESWRKEYENLYSDHVPVVADVTLL